MGNKRTEINKRWQSKNKDHANYLKARSTTRSFIKNKATNEDLQEFKGLIKTREEELKENK
ncbi:hypothetical protein [Clostridium neonatale]|uniref:Uncharacterized protein n=1 Tax=Clostridium neonatale TaxID=137838 RepID=A0AAD1YM19_9CLOT|nr:hypothetical protein [Clostridium neonatale]MBP8312810.1 hypothetical protein [Clostridium neonatale]CAI3195256.1 conserved hypothetical protein [Clostridium neonatale]CAI3214075.1 conserved hypothetical protein [Clostridium neonatale]CAI3216171.1 conserved hypothetical protein [Clostridium neonatale]CAI3216690.1 conserved hypothetical protein [Clostridium neonatale]